VAINVFSVKKSNKRYFTLRYYYPTPVIPNPNAIIASPTSKPFDALNSGNVLGLFDAVDSIFYESHNAAVSNLPKIFKEALLEFGIH
jgi:hypothetical protein